MVLCRSGMSKVPAVPVGYLSVCFCLPACLSVDSTVHKLLLVRMHMFLLQRKPNPLPYSMPLYVLLHRCTCPKIGRPCTSLVSVIGPMDFLHLAHCRDCTALAPQRLCSQGAVGRNEGQMPWILAWTLLNVDLLFAGKFGTAASTGVVMPPKPQMIAKQDWRYVSGGGRVMRNAHEPSTEITSLAFASNGHSLASRGADETLKVFLTVCVSFCFYLSV